MGPFSDVIKECFFILIISTPTQEGVVLGDLLEYRMDHPVLTIWALIPDTKQGD